jgi:hypothetical protein
MKDPGVVRQPAFRPSPSVEVNQLPRRGNTDLSVVESKTFGVLHEVRQVGVIAGEFPGAVDPKRIVRNHRAS